MTSHGRKSNFSPPPATTLESRENQLIAAAVDMAEEQIRNRTASAQVLTHYLKLGTTVTELERDKLRNENELLKAKVGSLASAERMEKMYQEAIVAMRSYQGQDDSEIIDDENV